MTKSTALLAAFALLTACGGSSGDAPAPPADTTAAAPAPAAPESAAAAPADTGFVDPNSATREQLAALPGMTPAAADAVVAGRPYADMRGVAAALGAHVDSAGRETVFARLWKPLDLNAATAEEIELIPGVGRRMRREFEEYRPYGDMARFRREIGKYVGDAEVERLARYVVINP